MVGEEEATMIGEEEATMTTGGSSTGPTMSKLTVLTMLWPETHAQSGMRPASASSAPLRPRRLRRLRRLPSRLLLPLLPRLRWIHRQRATMRRTGLLSR